MSEASRDPTPEEAALTVVLNAAFDGDDEAARRLWEAVYEDLRVMAQRAVSKESPTAGLAPTQVVHEVFLRLHGSAPSGWDDRRHFFGAAVRAMERFLVDHGRERHALKRGGGTIPVSLSVYAGELADFRHATRAASDGLVSAVQDLEAIDPDAAEVARLRWLVGLSSEQVADIRECSIRKVQLDWRFAKAFLQRRLAETDG